jgi:hypothetical protein
MDDKNPFSAPVSPQAQPSFGPSSALLGQLKALCIIMIVVGVLEILMGLFYAVMAFVMPTFLANAGGPLGGNGMQAQQQQTMQIVLAVIYGGGGGLAMLAGTLRIVAGIQGLRLKGWKLGIAAHLTGLLSSLTCYCAPTALALAIWGMILYLMPEVKYAFQNSEAGGLQGQANDRYSQ